jgi:hypothetical protein
MEPKIIDIVGYYDSMLLASEFKVCFVGCTNKRSIDGSRYIDATLP